MASLPARIDGSVAVSSTARGSSPAPMVAIEGDLVKAKSGHKRYVVLWADCPDRNSEARLEIYDDKRTFQKAKPPKRTILATAMQGVAASDPKDTTNSKYSKRNISQASSPGSMTLPASLPSHKHAEPVTHCFTLLLHRSAGENLPLGTSNLEEYHEWMGLLRDFSTGVPKSVAEKLGYDGWSFHPGVDTAAEDFNTDTAQADHVYNNLKLSKSDQGAKIRKEFNFSDSAPCSFCFNMYNVVLIRPRQTTPFFVIEISCVRRCGTQDNRIHIHSGRHGPYGEGRVHLEAQSTTQAEEIKSKLYEVMKSGAPQQTKPSYSSQTAYIPLHQPSGSAYQTSNMYMACSLPPSHVPPSQWAIPSTTNTPIIGHVPYSLQNGFTAPKVRYVSVAGNSGNAGQPVHTLGVNFSRSMSSPVKIGTPSFTDGSLAGSASSGTAFLSARQDRVAAYTPAAYTPGGAAGTQPYTLPQTAIPSTLPQTAIPSTLPQTAIPSTLPQTATPVSTAATSASPGAESVPKSSAAEATGYRPRAGAFYTDRDSLLARHGSGTSLGSQQRSEPVRRRNASGNSQATLASNTCLSFDEPASVGCHASGQSVFSSRRRSISLSGLESGEVANDLSVDGGSPFDTILLGDRGQSRACLSSTPVEPRSDPDGARTRRQVQIAQARKLSDEGTGLMPQSGGALALDVAYNGHPTATGTGLVASSRPSRSQTVASPTHDSNAVDSTGDKVRVVVKDSRSQTLPFSPGRNTQLDNYEDMTGKKFPVKATTAARKNVLAESANERTLIQPKIPKPKGLSPTLLRKSPQSAGEDEYMLMQPQTSNAPPPLPKKLRRRPVTTESLDLSQYVQVDGDGQEMAANTTSASSFSSSSSSSYVQVPSPSEDNKGEHAGATAAADSAMNNEEVQRHLQHIRRSSTRNKTLPVTKSTAYAGAEQTSLSSNGSFPYDDGIDYPRPLSSSSSAESTSQGKRVSMNPDCSRLEPVASTKQKFEAISQNASRSGSSQMSAGGNSLNSIHNGIARYHHQISSPGVSGESLQPLSTHGSASDVASSNSPLRANDTTLTGEQFVAASVIVPVFQPIGAVIQPTGAIPISVMESNGTAGHGIAFSGTPETWASPGQSLDGSMMFSLDMVPPSGTSVSRSNTYENGLIRAEGHATANVERSRLASRRGVYFDGGLASSEGSSVGSDPGARSFIRQWSSPLPQGPRETDLNYQQVTFVSQEPRSPLPTSPAARTAYQTICPDKTTALHKAIEQSARQAPKSPKPRSPERPS